MTKFLGIALAVAVGAAAAPSVQRGRTLFADKSLGTNGRSCATCHDGGKRLKELGKFDDARLRAYVNSCIQRALNGKPLPPESEDLRSLVLYLRTFQKEGR